VIRAVIATGGVERAATWREIMCKAQRTKKRSPCASSGSRQVRYVDALSWSHAKHHDNGIDAVLGRPCGSATTNSAVQCSGVRQLSLVILRLVPNKAERPVRSPPRIRNRCCGTPYLFRAEYLPCTLHPHRCKSVTLLSGCPLFLLDAMHCRGFVPPSSHAACR